MLWLKLLAGLLAFTYLSFLILKYKRLLPYVIILNLVYFYINGSTEFKVGSVNIFAWDIIFLFCVINLMYRFFIEGVSFDAPTKTIVTLLLAYLAYIEFSEIYNFTFSPYRHAVDDLIRTSIANLYPLIALTFITNLNRENFKQFLHFVALCGVLLAVWTIVKEVFDLGGGFKTSSGTVRRMRGEVILIVQLALIYFLFSAGTKPLQRYLAISLTAVAIALIGHRSGFLSLAAIILLYLIFIARHGELGRVLITMTPVAALGGIVLLGIVVSGKVESVTKFVTRAEDTFDVENQTSEGRLFKWEWALRSTWQNPLGGTKLNLLPNWYGNYTLQANYGYLSTAEAHQRYIFLQGKLDPWPPHNMFINIASKNGLIALLLFMLFFLAILRKISADSTPREKFLELSGIAATDNFLFFNNHHSYDAATQLFLAILVIPVLYSGGSRLAQEIKRPVLPLPGPV